RACTSRTRTSCTRGASRSGATARATSTPSTTTATTRLGVNQGIDATRLFRIDREADAADFARRQAGGELHPLLAAVGRLEHAAIRSAADHLADVPHA